MIYGVYSSRDDKTVYGAPVLHSNDEFARRVFLNSIWSQKEDFLRIGVHPQDFSLYKIGEFDDESGELTACKHVYIASGRDLVFEVMNPSVCEVISDA